MLNKTELLTLTKNFISNSSRKVGTYLKNATLDFFKQLLVWIGILICAIVIIFILFATPAMDGIMQGFKKWLGLAGKDSATAAGAVATMLVIIAFILYYIVRYIEKLVKKTLNDYNIRKGDK